MVPPLVGGTVLLYKYIVKTFKTSVSDRLQEGWIPLRVIRLRQDGRNW